MKTPKKTPKKAAKLYHLTIEIAGDVYDFETDDIVESLLNFHTTRSPMSIKSKVMIRVSSNGKHYEKMFLPRLARRYFVTPNFANVLAKNVRLLLK